LKKKKIILFSHTGNLEGDHGIYSPRGENVKGTRRETIKKRNQNREVAGKKKYQKEPRKVLKNKGR